MFKGNGKSHDFYQIIAGEDSGIEWLHKKWNTRPTKKKKDKSETSTDITHWKR